MMQPKLCDAEQRSTFCIRDYASRIMDTLKTSDQQKINFDDVFQKESSYEVARYFLASLDLVRKIIRKQEKSESIHQFLTKLIINRLQSKI